MKRHRTPQGAGRWRALAVLILLLASGLVAALPAQAASPGTVWSWGRGSGLVPAQVSGLDGIVAVSEGGKPMAVSPLVETQDRKFSLALGPRGSERPWRRERPGAVSSPVPGPSTAAQPGVGGLPLDRPEPVVRHAMVRLPQDDHTLAVAGMALLLAGCALLVSAQRRDHSRRRCPAVIC